MIRDAYAPLSWLLISVLVAASATGGFEPPSPEKSLARYSPVRPILSGRSGSAVSEAIDSVSRKRVVVKCGDAASIRGEENAYERVGSSWPGPEARELFPPLIDSGRSDAHYPGLTRRKGEHFLVFGLVGGMELKEYLATAAPSWRDCLSVLFQMAFALNILQASGLRHCDLHARNVLVDPWDPHGPETGSFVLPHSGGGALSFDLTGCPRVRVVDLGLSQNITDEPPRPRHLPSLLARFYQSRLRTRDFARVRLKLPPGHRVSPELLGFVKGNPAVGVCANLKTDDESLLGIEDSMVRMHGMEGILPASERIPSPGTSTAKGRLYYDFIASGRFEGFRV